MTNKGLTLHIHEISKTDGQKTNLLIEKWAKDRDRQFTFIQIIFFLFILDSMQCKQGGGQRERKEGSRLST